MSSQKVEIHQKDSIELRRTRSSTPLQLHLCLTCNSIRTASKIRWCDGASKTRISEIIYLLVLNGRVGNLQYFSKHTKCLLYNKSSPTALSWVSRICSSVFVFLVEQSRSEWFEYRKIRYVVQYVRRTYRMLQLLHWIWIGLLRRRCWMIKSIHLSLDFRVEHASWNDTWEWRSDAQIFQRHTAWRICYVRRVVSPMWNYGYWKT